MQQFFLASSWLFDTHCRSVLAGTAITEQFYADFHVFTTKIRHCSNLHVKPGHSLTHLLHSLIELVVSIWCDKHEFCVVTWYVGRRWICLSKVICILCVDKFLNAIECQAWRFHEPSATCQLIFYGLHTFFVLHLSESIF